MHPYLIYVSFLVHDPCGRSTILVSIFCSQINEGGMAVFRDNFFPKFEMFMQVCHRSGLIPGYRSIRRWTDNTYVVICYHQHIPDHLRIFKISTQGHVVKLFPRDHIFRPIPSYIGYDERIF